MSQHLIQKLYWIPVVIVWLFILIKYRRILGFKFRLLKEELRPGTAVFLPLLAIMAMLITFALVLPFSYDEAFTFTQFTHPGLQPAVSNYPAPNNHVFHSVLTCLTWAPLSFTQAELAVRIPALHFSAFTLYFVFTRYLAGNMYAIVLFGLLYLFSPNIIEFAFQARGYSIQIFCGIASYFFATNDKISAKIPFNARLNLILLLTVAGLFTSPAYLYTASCIYLVCVTRNFREIKKDFLSFAIINVFYSLTTILLYTPIIASRGLQTLTANSFVAPLGDITIGKELSHLNELVKYLTLPQNLGWIIILLFIWNTIKQKAYYNVYFLIIPLILMTILKQLPFYRVFLPFGGILLVNACLAITTSKGFNKITSAPLSFLKQTPALLLIAAGCILSYYYFDNYHKKDDLASAYRFKKIRAAIAGHKMVYTKNIGESWDLSEILSAYMKMHGVDNVTEIDRDLKEYDLKSSIILSSHPLPEFKLIDSTAGFDGKPVLIIDPGK